jgi:hypothetical protein
MSHIFSYLHGAEEEQTGFCQNGLPLFTGWNTDPTSFIWNGKHRRRWERARLRRLGDLKRLYSRQVNVR